MVTSIQKGILLRRMMKPLALTALIIGLLYAVALWIIEQRELTRKHFQDYERREQERVQKEFKDAEERLAWCTQTGGAIWRNSQWLFEGHHTYCQVAGMRVFRDEFTGCQYFSGNSRMSPRMDATGKQICNLSGTNTVRP